MKFSFGSHGIPNRGNQLLVIAIPDPGGPLLWLSLMLALLFLGLMFWQRRRHKRAMDNKMKEVREQMARDFHDELGSKLTVITLYGELARQALGKGQAGASANAYMEKVIDASHQLYSSMKDLIWTLRPSAEKQDDLWNRLEKSGKEIFADTKFTFQFHLDERLRHLGMPGETSKDILLLVKEAIHNVRRHAGGRSVILRARFHRDELVIEVEDDGHGFDPGKADHGEGLNNMRLRATRLGGRLNLYSSDKGTRVQLHCPLPPG